MIKKTYSEAPKQLICPNCDRQLVMDDIGMWYCPSCAYEEENNITRCRCECDCMNLVLSKSVNFDELTDRFCSEKHVDGGTCLQYGEAERAKGLYEADAERDFFNRSPPKI